VAALKVVDVPALLRTGVDSVQLEKDLLREVGLMRRLSHIKGITSLLEAFIETSGVVHLVMELCYGPTLQVNPSPNPNPNPNTNPHPDPCDPNRSRSRSRSRGRSRSRSRSRSPKP
jgi:serine/threonine protein kinase